MRVKTNPQRLQSGKDAANRRANLYRPDLKKENNWKGTCHSVNHPGGGTQLRFPRRRGDRHGRRARLQRDLIARRNLIDLLSTRVEQP